jgi:hypothetical protein
MGGKGTINNMRGQQSHGDGNLNNIRSIRLFIPPVSVIFDHSAKIDATKQIHKDRIQKIIQFAAGKHILRGGFHADEIKIMQGLVVNLRKKVLYRLEEGPITLKTIKMWMQKQDSVIREQLASKMLVIFFVSLDNTISTPIATIPTRSITVDKYISIVKELFEEFKGSNVQIVGGSTDGWDKSDKAVEGIMKLFPEYCHVYDYVHLLKNAHNFPLKGWIYYNGVQFGL